MKSLKSLTLEEIAKLTQCELVGNPKDIISNVADLESATSSDASFLANSRYEQAMQKSLAGAIFIHPSAHKEDGKNYFVSEDPSLAFQKLVDHLHAEAETLTGFKGIHPTAVIHPTATIGTEVTIGPHAVIDQNVNIGNRTLIQAGCYIGPSTQIGEECILHPNVTIRERCILGNQVIIQPGAVIGSCGFGYITDKTGQHIKLNQVGNVTLEDKVEVGANTTIDRSRFKTTRIGRGTKIDNLVQIAHGVQIGRGNIIVSQTGISGSSETGDFVVMGGQVGVVGHVKITSGTKIGAKAGVSKSIQKPGDYTGVPAQPIDKHQRQSVHLRNIEKFVEKQKELEKRLELLEKMK